MHLLKQSTILFDLAHQEMLNPSDEDFSEFFDLLLRIGVKVVKNDTKEIVKDVLEGVDILVIGNPIEKYFSNVEVKNIVAYVMEGGGLLCLSNFGADFLQKTNLNDLIGTHFGIFFEKNLIKEDNPINHNPSSILTINKFRDHEITNQLREIVVGGACSFLINRYAKPLIETNDHGVWSEEYNSITDQWVMEEYQKDEKKIIAAYREYGRGKVVAIGDVDMFTNDSNIGINKLDNRQFIANIFKWLSEPLKESTVRGWALDQLGTLQGDIKGLGSKIDNIIETMMLLEKRITVLEKGLLAKKEI